MRMHQKRLPMPWRYIATALTFLFLISTAWYLTIHRSDEILHETAIGKISESESIPHLTRPLSDSLMEEIADLDRLVVVAHYHENLAWVQDVDIPVKVIEKDNPDSLDNLSSNNMTEPTSYLYYMIKYYDSLPDMVAFVHGHGDDQLLNNTVWTTKGYAALPHPYSTQSCNTRHKDERGWLIWLGDSESQPEPPEDLNVVSVSHEYMRAFHDLFNFLTLDVSEGGLGMTLPHYITTLCCSAFTVDRETIRRVPKDRLIKLYDYLEAGTNWRHGNAMEYVWTVLFNQPNWV